MCVCQSSSGIQITNFQIAQANIEISFHSIIVTILFFLVVVPEFEMNENNKNYYEWFFYILLLLLKYRYASDIMQFLFVLIQIQTRSLLDFIVVLVNIVYMLLFFSQNFKLNYHLKVLLILFLSLIHIYLWLCVCVCVCLKYYVKNKFLLYVK